MLTFGSLFAGIGGLDLGLERAGLACKWQVEIDAYCNKVLEKHWSNVRRYGDVRECGRHNLEPVDLICGGFPCQDVSHAGKRAGLKEGTRTGLWYEFARIIRELEPRWVLAENVPGLLSVDSGRGMGTVLRDLAEGGYDTKWDCIPAAAFGAPHLRYRIFIVGHAKRGRQSSSRAEQDRPVVRSETETFAGPGLQPNVAHACSSRRRNTPNAEIHRGWVPDSSFDSSCFVAHANGFRLAGRAPSGIGIFGPQNGGDAGEIARRGFWQAEPNVGRVADGVPSRMDRLRCLGNAVVPQVAEWLGRRITGADAGWR